MKTALAISQTIIVSEISAIVSVSSEAHKAWFAPHEIAQLSKASECKSMPTTESSVLRYIKRHEWNSVPDMARKRMGKGGGHEYHWSLLPQMLQNYLFGQRIKADEIADRQSHQALEEQRQRQLETTDLTGRQRQVMEARAGVLGFIEDGQIEFGLSRRQAILKFVAAFHATHDLAEAVAIANDRATRKCSISKATLFNWFKLRDENGVAALAPKLTRKPNELPSWFDGFLVFYARPQKPAAARALRNYTKSLPDPSKAPNYDQVQRALKKLDMTQERGGTIARHRGREGRLALKARMAYVTRSTADMLPTFVFTADGQTFDAEVAHPIHGQAFRPEITSIMDVATRKCVGWSVGLSENTLVIMDALRMASEHHGIPAIFYVDRGSGYKNDAVDNKVTGFCARMGTTKMHALPQNAQAKGMIERYNGTVLVPAAKEFDTYIGADMDREAGHKTHKITRKDLREFGISKTLPSWQAFLQAMRDEVDDYNNRPHSALNGLTPNEAWNAHVADGFEPVSVTKAESDDLFRPYVKRRTRRSQIDWLKNDYFHIDLEAYHGREVLVGYDIHNGDYVWVREISTDKSGNEVPGKLICLAKFAGNTQRYIPQTFQNAANEKRHKQRKRRLQTHMDEVDAELSPLLQITANQQPVFDVSAGPELIAIDGDIVASKPAKSSQPTKPKQRGGIPVFPDDLSLARWAIENAGLLKENHRTVLKECLMSPTARDYFELEGIDLNCLRDAIRAKPSVNETAQ